MIDPAARVGTTSVRLGDLILMGHTLLDLAAATRPMRHAAPQGTLDYAEVPDTMPAHVVRDYTRWCGHTADHEEHRDRLYYFLQESGWQEYQWQSFVDASRSDRRSA